MATDFTDRAKRVMQMTQQEASRLNHEYLDTGHLLFGLMKEGSGVAANVLANRGLTITSLRATLNTIIQPGAPGTVPPKDFFPHSPRLKKAIAAACSQAERLKHTYVGTEHLLLGLLADPQSVACQMLYSMGISPEGLRADTLFLLGDPTKETVTLSLHLSKEQMAALEEKRAARNLATPAETIHVLLVEILEQGQAQKETT